MSSKKPFLLFVVPILLVTLTVCGEGSSEELPLNESIFAKVIVTDVQLSADDETVESITVRTVEEDRDITMRFGDDIDPTIWGPSHLLGHVQSGKFGIQIGVTYIRTPDGVVVTEFSE